MTKVIKIKQSDIRKIANVVMEQQEFDDFDSKIQPEELPMENEIELTLAQDNSGVFYVLKNAQSGTPEIVAKVN